jgi:serine/threonine protein kinase
VQTLTLGTRLLDGKLDHDVDSVDHRSSPLSAMRPSSSLSALSVHHSKCASLSTPSRPTSFHGYDFAVLSLDLRHRSPAVDGINDEFDASRDPQPFIAPQACGSPLHSCIPPFHNGRLSLLHPSQIRRKSGLNGTLAAGCILGSPPVVPIDLAGGLVADLPLLGRGASGSVRIVLDERLGTLVARKTIQLRDKSRSNNGVAELAFARHARTTAENRADLHLWRNIVEIHDAFLDGDEQEVSVTMVYMVGGPVSGVPQFAAAQHVPICHHRRPRHLEGGVPLEADDEAQSDNDSCSETSSDDEITILDDFEQTLAVVAADVLRGLVTLHDDLRVLHRDLKPENILIDTDGTAKLADFGVAALLPPDRDDADDQVGTYLYMSPERLRGDRHGPKADVWSLGVTALQLALYGKYPLLALTADQGNRFWSLVDALGATEGESRCREVVLERVEAALDEIANLRGNASPAFRDFIRAALTADSEERASVDALLGHEWLQRTFSSK